MKTQIVIGLGFGDEGKGVTTDMLADGSYMFPRGYVPTLNPALVIRFSGGHQAGHTVWKKRDGKTPYSHVFAQIGAGALSGAHTFYSRYCTFFPMSFVREYDSIKNFDGSFEPIVYIDELAPVATPYDVAYNRVTETINKHGSCGVGFAATVERHQKCQVYAQDLKFPRIMLHKLTMVQLYYESLCERQGIEYHLMEEYLDDAVIGEYFGSIDKIVQYQNVNIVKESDILRGGAYDRMVFEGSQGVMLDMEWGFFPNVTRSHTTSKNAMEIIKRNGLPLPELFYVTRAYSTRHGNGPMSNNARVPFVREISEETNKQNDWQGSLRTGLLDIDLLKYAIECDSHFSSGCPKNLIVTCLDQVSGLSVIDDHKIIEIDTVKNLLRSLEMPETTKVMGGFSPFSADIKTLSDSISLVGQAV